MDDCAASKEVKASTGQLVSLGFSDRHAGISVAAIVLFYTLKTVAFIGGNFLPRFLSDDDAKASLED